MTLKEIKKYGMTFNNWNEMYHNKGREKGGTRFLEEQLLILNLAVENAKQLDDYYSTTALTPLRWNFK